MTILDTFYILFKTNSDEVKKGTAEAKKSVNQLEDDLKKTNREAKDLGQSFVKLVEGAATAAASLVTLGAMKAGISDAVKFNANLELQGRLLNQNRQDLNAYGKAAAAAGGSVEGYFGAASTWYNNAASAGINPGQFSDYLKKVRGQVQKISDPTQRTQFLNQIPSASEPGIRNLLTMSDSEFNEKVSRFKALAQATDVDTKASYDNMEATEALSAAKQSFWTKAIRTILPGYNSGVNDTATGIGGMSQGQSMAAGGAMGVAALYGVKRGVMGLLGRLGIGAGAGAAAETAAGIGAGGMLALGTAAVGTGALIYHHKVVANWIDRQMHGAEDDARYKRWHPTGTQSDLSYWMSQGYSPAQAAGIVANMNAESGGNAKAVGDGGRAHGLFQWHPDRRANILKNTGIDINSASHDDQLKAAAWEMKYGRPGFDDAKFRGMTDPAAAASYFSTRFESPADTVGQAMKRAAGALGIMSSGAFGSSSGQSTSVKIEKVEINTQATDAKGIAASISSELSSILSNIHGNIDDGQKA